MVHGVEALLLDRKQVLITLALESLDCGFVDLREAAVLAVDWLNMDQSVVHLAVVRHIGLFFLKLVVIRLRLL